MCVRASPRGCRDCDSARNAARACVSARSIPRGRAACLVSDTLLDESLSALGFPCQPCANPVIAPFSFLAARMTSHTRSPVRKGQCTHISISKHARADIRKSSSISATFIVDFIIVLLVDTCSRSLRFLLKEQLLIRAQVLGFRYSDSYMKESATMRRSVTEEALTVMLFQPRAREVLVYAIT